VKVTKTSAKKGNKPAKRAAAETVKALSGRKLIAAVAAEAGKYRPDLKVCCVPAAGTAQSAIHYAKCRLVAGVTRSRDAHSLMPVPLTHCFASSLLRCVHRMPPSAARALSRRACV